MSGSKGLVWGQFESGKYKCSKCSEEIKSGQHFYSGKSDRAICNHCYNDFLEWQLEGFLAHECKACDKAET